MFAMGISIKIFPWIINPLTEMHLKKYEKCTIQREQKSDKIYV